MITCVDCFNCLVSRFQKLFFQCSDLLHLIHNLIYYMNLHSIFIGGIIKVVMAMRRTVPKSEEKINQGDMRNNLTYINPYPIETQSDEKMPITSLGERIINSSFMSPKEMTETINKMIKDKEKPEKSVIKYFKSISSKPIISNMPRQFNQEKYPLEDQEMVKVCAHKMFEIKNYYNYLYEEEIEKANKKINQRNRQIQLMSKAARIQEEVYEEPTNLKQQEVVLDPTHAKFMDSSKTFNPKQKQRLELSKGPSNQYGSNNYTNMYRRFG